MRRVQFEAKLHAAEWMRMYAEAMSASNESGRGGRQRISAEAMMMQLGFTP